MSLRLSEAGARRRVEAIRRSPDWSALATSPIPESPVEAPRAARRLRGRHKVWLALLAGTLVGLPLWFAFRDADAHGTMPRATPAPSAVMDVELPPAPPEPPQDVPTDPVPPLPREAVVASVPSTPSVGLVSTGPTGGSGNGVPGLDLGLEGNARGGMLVASGGGGSGGGVGTGTGSGVGTSRFFYQPGQVDQDARPSGTLAEPAYPRRADEDGIEAMVEVRLLIDERGRVEQIEVLGAPPGYGFEAALKKTSTRWRFEPARLGGVTVPQWVRLPWHFKRPN